MLEQIETVQGRTGGSENMFLLGDNRPFILNTIMLLIITIGINGKGMAPNQPAFFANDGIERFVPSSNFVQNIVFRWTAQVALAGGIYDCGGFQGIRFWEIEIRHKGIGNETSIYKITLSLSEIQNLIRKQGIIHLTSGPKISHEHQYYITRW